MTYKRKDQIRSVRTINIFVIRVVCVQNSRLNPLFKGLKDSRLMLLSSISKSVCLLTDTFEDIF